MQGPNAVLNVVTYPAGAQPGEKRIVIDGVRAAIFEYEAGTPGSSAKADNPLLSSWAASAGTDPYGNGYPQGMSIGPGSVFEGTDFVIDTYGGRFYLGTPAADNLGASIAPGTSIDAFNNFVFAALLVYIIVIGGKFTGR